MHDLDDDNENVYIISLVTNKNRSETQTSTSCYLSFCSSDIFSPTFPHKEHVLCNVQLGNTVLH